VRVQQGGGAGAVQRAETVTTDERDELSVPRAGDVIAGKYRVEHVLGTGAMGIVLAAHHLHLDGKFAIKLLRPELMDQPEFVTRFASEARAVARIRSEHVVRVVDVGALPNGLPYMVMEHLEGDDLESWRQKYGPLPTGRAVEFLLQACVAVADVHVLGMVHRDLKPANLFCVRHSDGRVSIKLLDFGTSKASGPALRKSSPPAATTAPLSESNTAVQEGGSPGYMSPEQLRGVGDPDTRTDIWSLGVILFELLTADLPFKAALPELASVVATAPMPSIRAARPDVPEALEAVIAKCLQKSPSQRFGDVVALAAALKPFAPEGARLLAERVAAIFAASGAAKRPLQTVHVKRIVHLSEQSAPASRGPVGAAVAALVPSRLSSGRRAPRASSPVLRAVVFGTLCALALLAALGARWGSLEGARASSSRSAESASYGEAAAFVPLDSAALPEPSAAADTERASVPDGLAPPPLDTPAQDAALPRKTPRATAPIRTAPGLKSPPAASSGPPAPSCDPPYYFDANGNRLFKKECV